MAFFPGDPTRPTVNSTPTTPSVNNFLTNGQGITGALNNIDALISSYSKGKALIEGSSGGGRTPASAPDEPTTGSSGSGGAGGNGFNMFDLIPESLRNRIYADAENDYLASLNTRYNPGGDTVKYIGYGAAALAAVYFLPKVLRRLK